MLQCLSSCSYKRDFEQNKYTIYWQDNNLCITIPHPTMGIVHPGLVDWRGVNLEKVVEDIYKECSTSKSSGSVNVWVFFENPQTDKYGNVTMKYDDYLLATIPLSEARKYKSSRFLDAEYKLTEGVRNVAFGSTKIEDDYGRKSQYLTPKDTFYIE